MNSVIPDSLIVPHLQALLSDNKLGVVFYDTQGKVTLYNRRAKEDAKKLKCDFLEIGVEHISTAPKGHTDTYAKAMLEALSGVGCELELWLADAEKSGKHLFTFSPVWDETKKLLGVCVTHLSPERMPVASWPAASTIKTSHRDSLTELPDHTALEQYLKTVPNIISEGSSLTLISFSVDQFGRINGSLGADVGDELLRQVAQRLVHCIREVDFVARRGGDEFVVVLQDLQTVSHSEVHAWVDRIMKILAEPYAVHGHEFVCTVSGGVAVAPKHGELGMEVLRCAELARLSAKQNARGKLVFFEPAMKETAKHLWDLEKDMREGMSQGQFFFEYQPKFKLVNKEMTGTEALMRWKHPKRGLISPMSFIPAAERSGLILPLGTWALFEVIRQRKVWLDKDFNAGRVSVNVSPQQFAQKDFVGTVKRALEHAGLSGKYLELEVTETTIMQDVHTNASKLEELRSMGIRISVDDFGTGYSSLSYLQLLPVDDIKIDRAFVKDLDREGSSKHARLLTEAITFLGHGMGLTVVAEGVETEAQLEMLRELGADEIQGYLWSRPISVEALETQFKAPIPL